MNRYYMSVPFAEKDEAKSLGARWDSQAKQWYYTADSKDARYDRWKVTDVMEDKGYGGRGQEPAWKSRPRDDGYVPKHAATLFTKLNIPDDFIMLDTETTGLENDDEVVELGIIDARGNELYSCTFKPEKEVNPEAAKVSGLTNEKLAGSPLFKDEWPKIKAVIADHPVIAHNIDFDSRLLAQTARKYGLEDDYKFARMYDTRDMARKAFKMQRGGYSMQSLSDVLGLGTEKHRAVEDCQMELQLLRIFERCKFDIVAEPHYSRDQQYGKSYSSQKKSGYSQQSWNGGNHQELTAEQRKQLDTLLAKGTPSDRIAEALGITKKEAENELKTAIKRGRVPLSTYVSAKSEAEVRDVRKILGSAWNGRLTPIKNMVSDSVSWDDIRLTLAAMDSSLSYYEARDAISKGTLPDEIASQFGVSKQAAEQCIIEAMEKGDIGPEKYEQALRGEVMEAVAKAGSSWDGHRETLKGESPLVAYLAEQSQPVSPAQEPVNLDTQDIPSFDDVQDFDEAEIEF